MRLAILIVILVAFGFVSWMINDLYGLIARTNMRFNKVIEIMQPYIPPMDGFKVFPRDYDAD